MKCYLCDHWTNRNEDFVWMEGVSGFSIKLCKNAEECRNRAAAQKLTDGVRAISGLDARPRS